MEGEPLASFHPIALLAPLSATSTLVHTKFTSAFPVNCTQYRVLLQLVLQATSIKYLLKLTYHRLLFICLIAINSLQFGHGKDHECFCWFSSTYNTALSTCLYKVKWPQLSLVGCDTVIFHVVIFITFEIIFMADPCKWQNEVVDLTSMNMSRSRHKPLGLESCPLCNYALINLLLSIHSPCIRFFMS